MPSAEVNSVMISPHPPKFRMNRRNTVSVTPAMGASTVAGAMRTLPIASEAGTGTACVVCVARAPSPASGPELSQYLRTSLFYLCPPKTKARKDRGGEIPHSSQKARRRVGHHGFLGTTWLPLGVEAVGNNFSNLVEALEPGLVFAAGVGFGDGVGKSGHVGILDAHDHRTGFRTGEPGLPHP